MTVYYWQLNNIYQNITNVIPLITQDYIETKANENYSVFNAGFLVVNPYIGRLNMAISQTEFVQYKIFDVLNNDITDEFDAHYFQDSKIMLYTSKNFYSHSSINFKITT
jgi:hypothetical protein